MRALIARRLLAVTAMGLLTAGACAPAVDIGATPPGPAASAGPATPPTASPGLARPAATQPPLPTATPARPAPTAEAGPVGRWTTTVSDDDLRAGGITGKAQVAEHAGTYRLILVADRTWTRVGETGDPVRTTLARGTWVATAPDRVRLITAGPPEHAGEVVEISWRLEADRLVLDTLEAPDGGLAAVLEAHPWAPAP